MRKMEKYRVLTASETLVMKCIWDAEEEMSLAKILEVVNQTYHKDWKYQTVSTFLAILVKKGFIYPEREGHKVLYKILIEQDKYKAQQFQEFVNFWNKGSISQFLTTLYHKKNISDSEIEELRRALDRIDT